MAGRSIEDMSIAFIGAGNLATNLAKALYRKGFRIVQVYSRTKESAQGLAQTVEAAYTTELQAVTKEAQLYIVSLKDAAFVELLPQIVSGKENALWVHTAGSIPMNIWQGHVARYGAIGLLHLTLAEHLVHAGKRLGGLCIDDETPHGPGKAVDYPAEHISGFIVFLLQIAPDSIDKRLVAGFVALHYLSGMLIDYYNMIVFVNYFHRLQS